MTREEAIEAIKCNWPDSRYTILREALDMAISALRQQEHFRDATKKVEPLTNAQKIRAMSDEELAEFLTHINPINCQDCAFSHGWRCQPDRDDYSDFEKCKEGRKRWLQQPAEEDDHE